MRCSLNAMSFAHLTKKTEKQWIWLAMNKKTREIIGCYIRDRSAESAQGLLDSIPSFYLDNPCFYPDFWTAYQAVLSNYRHEAVGKKTGLTHYIERFNNTLGQRVSRLGRKTLSFSKKLENLKAAIWVFIHYDNRPIRQSF